NGEYHFCGLPNDAADDAILDEYQISIPSLPSDAVTSDIGGDDSLDSDGDSNGLGPIFTIPLPNTEADDAANDNSYEGYPDNQDNLSFDFGFIVEYDWADLPDNNDGGGVDSYATDNGDNGEGTGPSHKITQGIYMGSCVDGENNGQPSAADSADQDDANSGISLVIGGTCVANDDEDGIEFVTPLIAGNLACINVTATSAAAQAANLSGWIDFNGNGTLTDSGEAVLADVVAGSGTDLGGGVFEHCFTVPADTANSDTLYSRFRLSTDSGLSPFGAAGDGEVEDYAKQLACVGNYVFDDNDEDDTQSAGDLGIGNVTVNLVWGGKDGVIGTGSDDVTYATTTDANGEYHFCGLPSDANNDSTDDEYQLTAVNAPGISVTAGVGGDEALDSDGDIGGITTNVFSIPLPATLLDNASNDNSYEGYPDNQDDLTFDFGFVVDYDWGDLPDANSSASTSFPTTSADSGPRHLIVTDLYLGACVDGETDGQPD
ncbi:MAG: hypothetical protein KAG66_16300, partial [Methylococcales bacterium]|nr:hypothetical protein [Methylococcales bacterium]